MMNIYRAALPLVLGTVLGGTPLSYGADDTAKAEEKSEEKKGGGKEKKVVGDPIVAKIGNRVIRRGEVETAMRSAPKEMRQQMPHDKLFAAMRDQLVNLILLEEAGKKAGVEKSPEFQKRIDSVKAELISQVFLMSEVQKKVTDAAVDARYKKLVAEYPKGLEHQIFHILVRDKDKAKAIIARLDKGEDFAKVAKEESAAASREKGGDEGYVMLDMLPPQIKAAIEPLEKGKHMKEPVEMGSGFSIFKKGDSRDAIPPKREEVDQQLKQVVFQEEGRKLIKSLEAQKKIERFEEDGVTPAIAIDEELERQRAAERDKEKKPS
ncbi:MAG: peptidylprolyl isomerase [Holosporales bacterium]|nr:peptidylprolyl isomerase [Holosporales bacterium]